MLTEAVRRKPYSVVLLDEIEKAHPDVLEAFYNVFDKGVMEDGTGLVVDFRNTVILATSNVGAELLLDSPAEQVATPAFDERLRKVLLQTFRPAFLARMTVVPYRPLEEATLEASSWPSWKNCGNATRPLPANSSTSTQPSSRPCSPSAARRARGISRTC